MLYQSVVNNLPIAGLRMQSETAWLLILAAAIENVAAQGCLKAAQNGVLTRMRRAIMLAFVVILYASGLILYALSLETLELKAAYTVLVGGTVGGVAIFSRLFLQEELSLGQIAGLFIILLGVILLRFGSGGLSP